MPSLYNDTSETYTNEAIDLDRKACNLLQPLIESWVEQGYPIRQICHILHGSLIDMECESMIRRAANKRKEERKDNSEH